MFIQFSTQALLAAAGEAGGWSLGTGLAIAFATVALPFVVWGLFRVVYVVARRLSRED